MTERPALYCADAHPMRPDLLCALLSGHGGSHRADDGATWDDAWTAVLA